MPQRLSLRGTDFLTALLICVLMLSISAVFVYGDHLMWLKNRHLRFCLGVSVIFLGIIIYRMHHLPRPYLAPAVFRYKNVLPILCVCLIGELLLGAEHTLEEILYSEVMQLAEHTKTTHDLYSLIGVYAGIFISLIWFINKDWPICRLFAVVFACIFAYGLLMYSRIEVNTPIEYYHAAMIFRGAATAMFGISLMWSLYESVHDFEHFFMALFVFNIIHMYLGGAQGYGLYTTLFKHFLADNISRYDSLCQPMMIVISIKQIYGYVIWGALFMANLFLLIDIPRIRTGINKIPYWPVYAIRYLAKTYQNNSNE